jgi:hypothetical protein
MLRIGAPAWATVGASRARLVRKRAHCAAQATIVESLVAVAVLVTAVWGMVGFLTGGRIMVERTGQGVIAAQVAQQQLDRARALAYASIASSTGTQTVGGIVYSWVLTVTGVQADPADANSGFKQAVVTVTWPTGAGAIVKINTGIAP